MRHGVKLRLKRPWRNGTTQIGISADRFIDRLVALVPPARANTLVYGGVLAGNARLRPRAVRFARDPVTSSAVVRKSKTSKSCSNPCWAELMRHSFGFDVLNCPACGGRMRHIATVLSGLAIRNILNHEDHPSQSTARGPPSSETEPHYEPDEEALAQLDLIHSW